MVYNIIKLVILICFFLHTFHVSKRKNDFIFVLFMAYTLVIIFNMNIKTFKITLCLVLIPLMFLMYQHTSTNYTLTSMPIFVPKVDNMCYDPYGYITLVINDIKQTDNTIYDDYCVLRNHTDRVHYLPTIIDILNPYIQPNTTISPIVTKKFTSNNLHYKACLMNLFLIIVSVVYRLVKKPANKINNLVTCFSILYVLFMWLVLIISVTAAIFNINSLMNVSYCFSQQHLLTQMSLSTIFASLYLIYVNLHI